ncbi:MAG: serine/threonine-protein kinase [Nostocaceae cyanobacterium]|nr:serine/threonine-protein kinase [Nostocaceae cyanobacterium]
MNSSLCYTFLLTNPARQITYYALNKLGEGGFGSVWNGVTDARVPIAIKIIKPSSDPARDFLNWLNEQNILLQCLDHPHIVDCYDQFVCDDGSLVIIMEKAEGSLDNFLKLNGPCDPTLICSIGIQLCLALKHIHDLQLIHRDLTLRNILWFSDGRFKIADFGISKQTAPPEELARTFIGFKNAIPPELLNFGYSTYQSDIYQLGLVLLTLLTGSDPIPLNASREKTYQMINDGVPRQIAESLISNFGCGRLAKIISIMLRRRDCWRYKDVSEVQIDLLLGV